MLYAVKVASLPEMPLRFDAISGLTLQTTLRERSG
jgi:hypothetical protein